MIILTNCKLLFSCTMYTLYTLICTMYNMQCVQCELIFTIYYTQLCTMYTIHCIYIVQCIHFSLADCNISRYTSCSKLTVPLYDSLKDSAPCNNYQCDKQVLIKGAVSVDLTLNLSHNRGPNICGMFKASLVTISDMRRLACNILAAASVLTVAPV